MGGTSLQTERERGAVRRTRGEEVRRPSRSTTTRAQPPARGNVAGEV
jgi:hypothetical protein